MSIGVKTATGDVKIHSVHVVPADGYYTTQQIVENLELYSDVQNSCSKAITAYKKDGSWASYARLTSTSINPLCLRIYSISNDYKTISASIYRNFTTYVRIASGSVFPIDYGQEGTCTVYDYDNTRLRLYKERFSKIHPALTNKYPALLNGAWVDLSPGYHFYDLFTLQGASTNDYMLISKYGNTWCLSRWSSDSPPVFEGSTIVSTSTPGYKHTLVNPTSTAYYEDVEMLAPSDIGSSGFTKNTIVMATFDVKDTNNNLIFEKNANTTDYVKPTT